MRSMLENNIARQVRQMSGTYGVAALALTGAYRIPSDSSTIHVLDANGAARTVFLPPISPSAGQYYFVSNISGAFNLSVVDSNGITVTTVGANATGIFFSYRGGWRFLIQGGGTLAGLLEDVTVTSASSYVITTESTLAINRNNPVATAVTLPALATKAGLGPITVVDWSTNVVDHVITVTPNGAETIMRQTTWPMGSNAVSLAVGTFWPSTTLNGWFLR